MRKSNLIILLLFLLPESFLYGNMAAPWINGTNNSEMYLSKRLDVINEKLSIKILDYYQAQFDVQYTIVADSSYTQMLFIFDTMTRSYYSDEREKDLNFNVWIDDMEVDVLNAKNLYEESTRIYWSNELRSNYIYKEKSSDDFKYFKLDISKGVHVIRVKCTQLLQVYINGKSYKSMYLSII